MTLGEDTVTEEVRTAYNTTEELIYAYTIARTRLSEIEDKLHSTVVEAARRYAKIWTMYYKGYGLPHDMKSLDWAIIDDGGSVEIRWEDWWSYGGQDSGVFEFSIDFLLDELQFVKFESELIAKKEFAERKKLKEKEERERKLLASLRTKYEVEPNTNDGWVDSGLIDVDALYKKVEGDNSDAAP